MKETIDYQVGYDRINKYFNIIIKFTAKELTEYVLSMPTWCPGSYKIRDYVRNISSLKVTGATITQSSKSTWKLVSKAKQEIVIKYNIFANDYSVRGAFIEEDLGFMSGAATLMYIEQLKEKPHKLNFNFPKMQIFSSMPSICQDYFELIDHPVYFLRKPITLEVKVRGRTFHFVSNISMPEEKFASHLKNVIHSQYRIFSGFNNNQDYYFLTYIGAHYGGLEHHNSTALMFPQTEIVSDYKRFMELISHEFFHTWLVKGIAPAALVKPDLQREVYTRDLWLYEGVTSYYDLRQLLKAGIVDFKYFLNELAENYSNLRLYSGNKLESLADSSFNAWCGLYQANENFINTKTNYYRHGQILIFWLELILLLEGEMELDLVLKQLWQQYGKSKQPLPEGAEKVIAKILGRDYLTPLVHKPRLAELKTLLVKLGISCVTIPMEHNKKTGLLPQLGIYLAKDKFVVIRTLPDCLFQIDDELLAINERKLTAKNIQELLSVKKLKITIFRQGNLKHIEVLANSHLSYSFVANAKVTKEQKELQQKLGRVFD